MIARNDRQWSSMLQVLALSTVIQADIKSVYPVDSYASSLYSGSVHHIRKCHSPFHCRSPEFHPIIIFWSGSNSGDFFIPNHIVPLVNTPPCPTPPCPTPPCPMPPCPTPPCPKQLSIQKFNQLFSKRKGDRTPSKGSDGISYVQSERIGIQPQGVESKSHAVVGEEMTPSGRMLSPKPGASCSHSADIQTEGGDTHVRLGEERCPNSQVLPSTKPGK